MHEKLFAALEGKAPPESISRAKGLIWLMEKMRAEAELCPMTQGAPHNNRGDGLCAACGRPAIFTGIQPETVAAAMIRAGDNGVRTVWDVIPLMDGLERHGALRRRAGAPSGMPFYEVAPEPQSQDGGGAAPLGGPPPTYPGPGSPFSPTAPTPGVGAPPGGAPGPT